MVDTKFKKGLVPWIKGKKHSEETKKKMSETHKIKPSWTKGKPLPEELKRKLSESQKKAWSNPELRKKQSEAHKGQTSWNKGKKGLQVAWNKGKKGIFTQEQLSRMSEAKKGKSPWNKCIPMSKELRKKSSENHKGQIAWNKGKTGIYSEETKRKIGLSGKGRIPWNKGKKGIFTQEQLSRMSEAHKRTYLSNPELRKKVSESFKGKKPWITGKKHTPEALLKMGKSHKGQIAWNKGIPMGEESKIKISGENNPWYGKPSWNRGIRPSEETIKKQMETHRKTLSNPEVRKRLSEASRATLLRLYESGAFPIQTNTKPERQIKEELIRRGYKEGIDFIHQYKFMNKFMCDFCFPQQKVIVEAYGDFWHCNPKKYSVPIHKHQIKDIGRDKSKEAYITKVDNHTWTYLVLWESDIKKDVANCVDKIEEALQIRK